jgi:hypothetical protein
MGEDCVKKNLLGLYLAYKNKGKYLLQIKNK